VELVRGVFQIRWRSFQRPTKAHEREYPSGAMTLLTMGISAVGPIDKDSAPEKAARGKRKRRS
jgi:hypothetical protein